MSKVTIYHNPRCSKSREALKLLEEQGADVEVVKYLDTPPSKEELKSLLGMLGISARELMRTKEAIYKELGLKDVEDEEKLRSDGRAPQTHRASYRYQGWQSSDRQTTAKGSYRYQGWQSSDRQTTAKGDRTALSPL